MLGNNRDYKTNDRRARTNLAKHAEIMNQLIKDGMSPDAASAEALRRVLHPTRKSTKRSTLRTEEKR